MRATWRYFQSISHVFKKKTGWSSSNLTVGTLCRLQNFRQYHTLLWTPEVAPSASKHALEVQSAIEDDFAVELQLFTGKTAGQRQALCRFSISWKRFVEYLMHSHKRSSLESHVKWAIANALVDIAPIADELILLLSWRRRERALYFLGRSWTSKAWAKHFLTPQYIAVSNWTVSCRTNRAERQKTGTALRLATYSFTKTKK